MKNLLPTLLVVSSILVIVYVIFRNTNYLEGYLTLDLNPAPIGYHTGQGVPFSTSGFNIKYNPTKWDYLYNTPEAKNRQFISVQGTPPPLGYEEKSSTLPDESMFIFQKNIASPMCCPATFSTSKGCVCTTSNQRFVIGYTRGGNNSHPGAYPYI